MLIPRAVPLMLGLVISCSVTDSRSRAISQADVKRLVAEAIAERLSIVRGTPHDSLIAAWFPDSIVISTDTSRVVPGLRYHLGAFSGGANHGEVLVKVGELGQQTALVERPAQWALLVAQAPWRPQSDLDALGACQEIIRYVIRPGRAMVPPIFFRDSTSLAGGPLFFVEADRALILARAQPPAVRRGDGPAGWEVDLWAVESEITARYHCALGIQNGSIRVSIAAVDSLPCSGQFTSCGMSREALLELYGTARRPP